MWSNWGGYKLDLKKIAEKTNSYNAGSLKATVGKGVYLTVGISSGYTAGHWIGTGQKIFSLFRLCPEEAAKTGR